MRPDQSTIARPRGDTMSVDTGVETQIFVIQRYDGDRPELGWVDVSEHPYTADAPVGGTGPIVSRLRHELRTWHPSRGRVPAYSYRVVTRRRAEVAS